MKTIRPPKWRRCAQVQQDRFAYELIGNNGTYIEIGGHHPQKRSNTYNLDVVQKWRGFSVELDTKYKSAWIECTERRNQIYWANALTFDYKKGAKNNHLGMHVNYLSIDIEPPENTMSALRKVIEDGFSFDVITFEHDRYQCKTDFHAIACKYLEPKGYKVAVYDVWHKQPHRLFETWFVKDSLDFETVSYDQWLRRPNVL